MAILNPFSHAFGLDIGDRAFKLTQFMKRGKEYRLTAWGDIAVPEGVLDRGEIKDMDQAVALIGQLLRQTKGRLRGRAVVACLPEAKTFIKILSLPGDTENDKFKQAVLSEIELNIPLPADDIYYDWQEAVPLGAPQDAPAPAPAPKAAEPAPAADGKTPPKEEPKDDLPARPLPPKHLLLGAAPKSLVDSYTTMLEHAGLAPIALDIEAMAIARAIVPDTERDHGDPVGILDIGATRSSLVIYDAGSVQMSISIPISGIDITTVISDTLKVTMEDAELLKRECGLDANRCEDRMWTILLPLIDDMTMKIRNALRFFKIGFPEGKKIEKLYLCGGGAQFREIDAVLSRKLTIKVRKGDANANIGRSVPRGFPKDESLPYTTAIGLGLRAADENDKYRKRIGRMSVTLNLLSPEKKRALHTGFIMAFSQTLTLIFFLVAAFVAGTLLSVRFVIANNYEAITKQTTEAADESDRAAEDTKLINAYLKRIDALQKQSVPWSGTLAALSAATPDGVTVEFLGINPSGAIVVRGRARDRNDVLELRRRFSELPMIANVSNPLSNLLQKKDVKFEFDMQYAPPAPAPKP